MWHFCGRNPANLLNELENYVRNLDPCGKFLSPLKSKRICCPAKIKKKAENKKYGYLPFRNQMKKKNKIEEEE